MSSTLGKLCLALSFAAMMTKWSLSIVLILGTLIPSSFGTENSKLWHQKKRCRKKTADSLFCCVRIFTKAVLLASVILQAQTRGCHGCRENQVTWRSGNAAQNDICLPCADCPDGMEPSIPCGTVAKYGTHLHCVVCRVGTYSDKYGKDQCTPCSLCSEGRTVTRNCSATKNTLCGLCSYGYYMNDVVMSCLPCSACCWDGKDQLESKCIAQGLPKHRQCKPRHGDRCQLSTTSKVNTGGRIVITSPASVQSTSQKGKTRLPGILTTKHGRTETRNNRNTAVSLALSTQTTRQLPKETRQETTTSQTTANQLSIETTREGTTSLTFTKSTVVYGKARKSMLDSSKNKTNVIIAVSCSMVALALAVVIIKRNTIARYLRWARCHPVCRSKDSELGERTESSVVLEDIRAPVADHVKGVLCPLKILKSVSPDVYEKVWKRLDKHPERTKKGDFTNVAEEFGFAQEDIWEFEKEFKTPGSGSPSRQLLESLETRRPKLTVFEFIKVLQKPNIDRDDIVDILKEYIIR